MTHSRLPTDFMSDFEDFSGDETVHELTPLGLLVGFEEEEICFEEEDTGDFVRTVVVLECDLSDTPTLCDWPPIPPRGPVLPWHPRTR